METSVHTVVLTGDLESRHIRQLENDQAVLKRLKVEPVIFDVRQADCSAASAAAFYFLAEAWSLAQPTARIALLTDGFCRNGPFIANCFQNRGITLRTFTDPVNAENWAVQRAA